PAPAVASRDGGAASGVRLVRGSSAVLAPGPRRAGAVTWPQGRGLPRAEVAPESGSLQSGGRPRAGVSPELGVAPELELLQNQGSRQGRGRGSCGRVSGW
ncbi:hypothetical protein H1C71_039879, partial [Ictidomys tridecemlineatus]